jgi:hypothetical protein
VNKTVVDNKGILTPFLHVRISHNDNIVLTSFDNNIGHEAYLTIITQSLWHIGNASAIINQKWTNFLLHRVPATMEEIRNDIETYY